MRVCSESTTTSRSTTENSDSSSPAVAGPADRTSTRSRPRSDCSSMSSAVRPSPSSQRSLIEDRLATRISRAGILRVSSQRHRTREANRKATLERFVELIAGALEEEELRVPTRIPKAPTRRRLESKRQNRRKRPCGPDRMRRADWGGGAEGQGGKGDRLPGSRDGCPTTAETAACGYVPRARRRCLAPLGTVAETGRVRRRCHFRIV